MDIAKVKNDVVVRDLRTTAILARFDEFEKYQTIKSERLKKIQEEEEMKEMKDKLAALEKLVAELIADKNK